LLAGVLADILGMSAAIIIIGGITGLAGMVAQVRMCCTLKKLFPSTSCIQPELY
jgi:hypothetical protein